MTNEERNANTTIIPKVPATPPAGIKKVDPNTPGRWEWVALFVAVLAIAATGIAVFLAVSYVVVEQEDPHIKAVTSTQQGMDATVARMSDEEVAAACKLFFKNKRSHQGVIQTFYTALLHDPKRQGEPDPDTGTISSYVNGMCTPINGWRK